MIGNSISLDDSSETPAESAQSITSVPSGRSDKPSRHWLTSQNSGGNDSILESQRQLHELKQRHSQN